MFKLLFTFILMMAAIQSTYAANPCSPDAFITSVQELKTISNKLGSTETQTVPQDDFRFERTPASIEQAPFIPDLSGVEQTGDNIELLYKNKTDINQLKTYSFPVPVM